MWQIIAKEGCFMQKKQIIRPIIRVTPYCCDSRNWICFATITGCKSIHMHDPRWRVKQDAVRPTHTSVSARVQFTEWNVILLVIVR